MEKEEIQLPPDIFDYLSKYENSNPINFKENNEELLFKIKAKIGMDTENINIILNAILEEIKINLVNGKSVSFNPLGTFYFSKSGRKILFYPLFSSLVRRIRYGRWGYV